MRLLFSAAGAIAIACAVPAAAQTAAGDLVAQAREAARTDRNAESARLFEQAITADPALRLELLREYADQLTYSDRAADAVPLYKELLAREDLAADDRVRLLRSLALALSWSGRHHDAVAAYTQVLAANARDVDALVNRAKVQVWRQNYRSAQRDLEQALAIEPANAEAIRSLAESQSYSGRQREALTTLARLPADHRSAESLRLLARTQYWSGRPGAARESLAQVMAVEPDDRAAAALGDEVELSLRPQFEATVRHSDQSNDTSFTQASAWQTVYPSEALTLSLGYDGFFFRSDDGGTLDVHRPAVTLGYRPALDLQLNAQLGLTVEEELAKTDIFPTYNLWASYLPSDGLRIDAGINRSTLDNLRSGFLDIRTNTYSLSADVGTDLGWKAIVRGTFTNFSDGNERIWGQAEIRRRVSWSPNVFLGARYTRFSFAEILDNGYFNPDSLQAIEATAQVWGRTGAFYYDVRGAVGREDTRPGDPRFVYSGEARLSYLVNARHQLELFVNSFSSRAGAPGGFSRTTTGLAWRVRW